MKMKGGTMKYKPQKKKLITTEALRNMSAKEVQKKFKVSQATAYRWLKEKNNV